MSLKLVAFQLCSPDVQGLRCCDLGVEGLKGVGFQDLRPRASDGGGSHVA